MVDYKINLQKDSFYHDGNTDTIYIGGRYLSELLDNELIEYISDSITHEFIHSLLEKLFNNTTTHLFDAIEHNFRSTSLHQKAIDLDKGRSRITWKDYIAEIGFNGLLTHYGISNNDLNQSRTICNKRTELEFIWVEIFGLPRYRKIQGETPENIVRIYPNHVILKIEVV